MTNASAMKGGAYERKVRDILTDFYKIQFERVPQSGSLHYLKGDVWAPNHMHLWQYTIECKHYKELDFNGLLTAKSNDIYKFWEQTLEQAKKMNKEPLLIFRWNRSKNYVAWGDDVYVTHHMRISAFGYLFKIALLDDWLKANTKQQQKFN